LQVGTLFTELIGGRMHDFLNITSTTKNTLVDFYEIVWNQTDERESPQEA